MLKVPKVILTFFLFSLCSSVTAEGTESDSKFAVGSSLDNPISIKLTDAELLLKTVRPQQRTNTTSAEGTEKDYLKAHRTDRGRVFEAMIANAANKTFSNEGKSARVLVVAAEMDEPEKIKEHPADLLLWDNGQIMQRYQLKSYQNSKDVIAVITQPKKAERYKNEVIVTHPEKLAEIRKSLSEQTKPLNSRWQKVERALSEKRLTDEVPPGRKVPSLVSTQQATDDFLRKEYEQITNSTGK